MFASSLTHTHATSIYLLSLHDALPISRDALQTQIAGLETGNDDTGYAYTFSSGLAAETALLMATCVPGDRKSTRLNSSHVAISYAVFCLKKKKNKTIPINDICRICIDK